MFATGISFTSLGVAENLADRLAQDGLETPTNAQAAVIPILLQGLSMQLDYATKIREFDSARRLNEEMERAEEGDGTEEGTEEGTEDVVRPTRLAEDIDDVLMFGAETGSGKTLAYLLPYVQTVVNASINVKAIILVPSRELCNQVAQFLQEYFDSPPAHIVLAGGNPPDVSDTKDVQVVIATPASLLNHMRFSRKVDISDKIIIVDEADMLLSGGYLQHIEAILDQPGMKPFATRRNGDVRAANGNRLVFVGATFPHWTGEKVRSIITWMKRRYPTVRSIQTGDIHRRCAQLQSRWFHLPTELERVKKLETILRNDVTPEDKIMVFCGKAGTVTRVRSALENDFGTDVLGDSFGGCVELHKNVRMADRMKDLQAFRKGEVRLLLCTDLASRGLDLGNVTRIIEFDFSTNVVSYLHRIGRTARAGTRGATDHFYDDVAKPLAEAIREKAETESTVVESVFSRRRGFRRKLKKRTLEAAEAQAEAKVEVEAKDLGSSKTLEHVEIDEMNEEEKKRWES